MTPTVTDLSVNVAGGQYGLLQSVDCTGYHTTTLFIHTDVVTVPMSLGGVFIIPAFVVLLGCAYIRFRNRLRFRHDAR